MTPLATTGHAQLQLRILGPMRICDGTVEVDSGPHQQRCLLALLMAYESRPVGLGELIDLLWGAGSPASAVNVIHKYIGRLRRLLEPGLPPRAPGGHIARHGTGYRFTAGPETLDLARFRLLVTQARARAEPGAALDDYLDALRLSHGPAGDGLAGTSAARAVLASLDHEFFDAVVAAAGTAVLVRRPGPLLAPLRRAAAMAPFDELVQASLVTCLAAAGRQAEALAAYESVRGRLTGELGIDPGPGLQEALRRVLGQRVLPPFCTGAECARQSRAAA